MPIVWRSPYDGTWRAGRGGEVVDLPPASSPLSYLAMPDDRDNTPIPLEPGEKRGARESMAEMTRRAVEAGATPEWAERKMRTAARDWDRRVEDGRIARPQR